MTTSPSAFAETAVQAEAVPFVSEFGAARFNMVENQIRANKVRGERLLDVLGRLPREIFVPASLAGIAYIDEDLEVAPGRFLVEPMVLARLIEAAHVKETDHVLDVAPATGYSTAVLAAMAKDVVALESDPVLQRRTEENLGRLGIGNAEVALGSFPGGCPDKAPYDVIFINGGIEVYPEILMEQLAEGGRLLFVARLFGVAHAAHKGEARLYEKIRGNVSRRNLFDANVQPLPGFRAAAGFVF